MSAFFMKNVGLYLLLMLLSFQLKMNGQVIDLNQGHQLSYNSRDNALTPSVKFGYTAFFNKGYSHLMELGYYHMKDYTFVSYGTSASVLAKVNQGNWVFGPKIGVEANVLLFDAKLDIAYLHPGFYIHPAIGFSILGKTGIMFGYNICVNQSRSSGFTIGLYYHLSPTRKGGLNKW